MACTITDFAVTIANNNVTQPVAINIIAQPGVLPFFDKIGGVFYEVGGPTFRVAVPNAFTGSWSQILPWPSESDPSVDKLNNPIQWLITTHDGAVWTGVVPEGNVGPLSIKQLKDTFGWKLTVGQGLAQVAQIVAVSGSQGPQGLSGASIGNSATAALGAAAGTGASLLASSIFDGGGKIKFKTGTLLVSGELFRIIFSSGAPYTTPNVTGTLHPGDDATARSGVAGSIFVDHVNSDATKIIFAVSLLSPLIENATYTLDYEVKGK